MNDEENKETRQFDEGRIGCKYKIEDTSKSEEEE